MNELDKTKDISLPAKIRSEHVPQVGDVYYENYSCLFYRIDRIENGRCYTSVFNFETGGWEDNMRYTSLDSLEQYYVFLVIPFDEVVSNFDRVMNGDFGIEQMQPVDSTDLVLKGKNGLEEMKANHEMAIERASMVEKVMKSKVECMKSKLEEKTAPLRRQVEIMNKVIANVKYAISVIEGYLGEGVEFVQVREGEHAAYGTKVHIRQRILFMDEEVACVGLDNQGLDYRGKETFYEWMKSDKNRDIIVPEERCIVIMKPKRFDHFYCRDSWQNSMENVWNHHSFVVIRDGDDVKCIESDNLNIHDKVFFKKPKKSEFVDLGGMTESEKLSYSEQRELEEADRRYKRTVYFCAVMQGLLEKGVIFGADDTVSIIKERNVELVFDDEEDTMIGTGIKRFSDFVSEKNKAVRCGSRILYYGGGEPFRYYTYQQSEPDCPEYGIYNVDVDEKGSMSIRYLPKGEVWNPKEGLHERRRKERWMLSSAKFVSYDNVSSKELEIYLSDRTQRKYYSYFIPLINMMKRERMKEEEWERMFAELMAREFPGFDQETVLSVIANAIKWWKMKVIYTRPLKSDDKKSWRMIKGYVQKNLKTQKM